MTRKEFFISEAIELAKKGITFNPSLRKITAICVGRQGALQVFEQWKNREDKIKY